MSGKDQGNAARIARALVAGVIAGAVASFAMDRFGRRSPEPIAARPAPTR